MKTKFPWLKMRKKTDPELPLEPPIWMKSYSNGECFYQQTERDKKLRQFVLETADANARRVGMDRREFLASAMGMATTLWCISHATGCSNETPGGGGDGGGLCVPPEAMFEEQPACELIDTSEYFIFDVQTHWFNRADGQNFPPKVARVLEFLYLTADEQAYINNMFLNSDTSMAVLTSWPGAECSDEFPDAPCGLPLSNQTMADSRDKLNRIAGDTQRVVQHVQVHPNDGTGIERQLEIMTQLHCERLAFGWKMYPGFASNSIDPRGTNGYFLTDPNARKVIEHGLKLGVKRFCVHKGLPILDFFQKEFNHPKDVGVVAKDYSDAKFIIYHSGIDSGYDSTNEAPLEGPFNPNDPDPKGVNALIRSLLDNGITPDSNVYAEVGSAILQVQRNDEAAAHFFGKLMKYVGVNRVVWGTDCVIYGSPQGFIDWFAALTIPEQMQTMYEYPPLDRTNKAKIFGLNAAALYEVDPAAARCKIQEGATARLKRQLDEELGGRRWVFQEPGGPRTWHEYVEHSRRNARLGRPG